LQENPAFFGAARPPPVQSCGDVTQEVLMSHHHDHPHDHSHDHDHHGTEMAADEKIARLLEHWIQHNDDHIRSYREWAEKARAQGLAEAAAKIDEAVEMTAAVSGAFREALAATRQG
jgi:hypothetical protein